MKKHQQIGKIKDKLFYKKNMLIKKFLKFLNKQVFNQRIEKINYDKNYNQNMKNLKLKLKIQKILQLQ